MTKYFYRILYYIWSIVENLLLKREVYEDF